VQCSGEGACIASELEVFALPTWMLGGGSGPSQSVSNA
jgi:hypothetical protein